MWRRAWCGLEHGPRAAARHRLLCEPCSGCGDVRRAGRAPGRQAVVHRPLPCMHDWPWGVAWLQCLSRLALGPRPFGMECLPDQCSVDGWCLRVHKCGQQLVSRVAGKSFRGGASHPCVHQKRGLLIRRSNQAPRATPDVRSLQA